MFKVVHGDIFTADTGIICHGVNCKRRMGSGIALKIRQKWPCVYESYMNVEDLGAELLGTVDIVDVGDTLFVANCYTQESFGHDGGRYANLDAIEKSLKQVMLKAERVGLPVHLPRIGSDLGGLDWDTEVFPVFKKLCMEYPQVDVTIYIYP